MKKETKQSRVEIFESFIETVKTKIKPIKGKGVMNVTLTEEERLAMAYVANSLQGQVAGWKASGKPRDENPTKAGLYLRKNRARLKMENLKANLENLKTGSEAKPKLVKDYEKMVLVAETEFNIAAAEYEDFMRNREKE